MFATARAGLKKAFRELRIPVCGRFYPNEGGVAGYGNRMRVKYTAKWGLQISEMIFQARSKTQKVLPVQWAAYPDILFYPLEDQARLPFITHFLSQFQTSIAPVFSFYKFLFRVHTLT